MSGLVKFERADGGGSVYVNPAHVAAVVAADASGKISKIVLAAKIRDGVTVVFGAPDAVVALLRPEPVTSPAQQQAVAPPVPQKRFGWPLKVAAPPPPAEQVPPETVKVKAAPKVIRG